MVDILPFISQFGDIGIGNILWVVFFIFFTLFYSRIIVSQMLWKLEQTAEKLEELTDKGKKIVIRKVSKNPSKQLKDSISNFLEFFMIPPVSLDPFGIVKKIEHVVNLEEKRFKYFVDNIAPHMDKDSQANLMMGLSGAISLNQIAKIVRHYVETIRKTKNLQLAMVLQMQVPLIERIAKALYSGTEALTNGWPIGDAVGNLVAARMVGNEKTKEMDEDTLLARRRLRGKQVLVMKAKGPGGRLGKLGKSVEKIIRREKISKIITIDAMGKLEGEKTGSTAEGIGVAIGGVGVDRAYIEDIAVKKNMPLDSFVIKMSEEEAIQPMKTEILSAVGNVIKLVEDNISKSRGKILVIGVGNSTGIGNNKRGAEESEKLIKNVLKILKERKEKEKKSKWQWLLGG